MAIRRIGLVLSVLVMAVCSAVAAWRVGAFTLAASAELDAAIQLAEIAPRPQSTIVFDRHGKPAFTYFIEQRIDVPLQQIAPAMVDAIVAIEDKRFFTHRGLDPVRVFAAGWRNSVSYTHLTLPTILRV